MTPSATDNRLTTKAETDLSALELTGRFENSKRIRSIDFMRGAAMVLVIYAHARILLDPATVWAPLYQVMVLTSSIASITFMFISGTMISYFFYSGRSFGRLYKRFAKRAALLIFACHILIRFVAYPTFAGEVKFTEYIFLYFPITDSIAISLLIAPLMLRYLNRSSFVFLLILFWAASPIIREYFMPGQTYLIFLKELMVGQSDQVQPIAHVFYPLLPWLALFLGGSFLGRALARVQTGQLSIISLSKKMRKRAFLLGAICLVMLIAYKMFKAQFLGLWDSRLFETIYPQRSSILMPGYLALLLFALSIVIPRIDFRQKNGFIVRAVAVFGRTSLFTYITHYAIAWSLPAILGLKFALNLPGFILSLIIIISLCWCLSGYYGIRRGWIDLTDITGPIRSSKKCDYNPLTHIE